jgi:hypothetical protein
VETISRQSLCNRHMIRQGLRRLSRIVRVHLGPNFSCHGRAFCLTTEDYASTVARGLQVGPTRSAWGTFVPAETPFVFGALLPKPSAQFDPGGIELGPEVIKTTFGSIKKVDLKNTSSASRASRARRSTL